jgi:hypothetical protein
VSRIVLLGPQRGRQTIGSTLDDLGVTGRVATITAGWQEWEGDDDALNDQIARPVVNLMLYERAEKVWDADPDFRAAHRDFQDRLRTLRRLYNRRLSRLAGSWMELVSTDGPAGLLEPERADALAAIQAYDRHHLDRIEQETERFNELWRPGEREPVQRERSGIAAELNDCEAVVIEGGHVALLYNRLRLFGLDELLTGRTLIACSGGAMALAERVVLFHDSPPQGEGNTEVALRGLGLYRGLIPLPHARTRLRLDDPERVARIATRLAPDRCVVFGPGTRLDWDGHVWTPIEAERLQVDGAVRRWEAAA